MISSTEGIKSFFWHETVRCFELGTMCGIAGIIKPGKPRAVIEPVLDGILNAIEHRGPDDWGKHFGDGLGIGVRRLSVIDLEGGHQPITSDDGIFSLVFNGEIYNFRDLRAELEDMGHVFRTRCDTEVLLHGYMAWKDGVLDRLNGMFAFALLDRSAGRLFLARDHFGIKPLYYVLQNDYFAFCSEPAPLMRLPGFKRSLNLRSLRAFFSYKYVPGPETFVENIRKLEPATYLIVQTKSLELTKKTYWHLRPNLQDLSLENAQVHLERHLTRAVERQMISDVPLGIFLSGGIDSGLLLWASRHCQKAEYTTAFTVGFKGPPSFDESTAARLTAQRLRCKHKVAYLPVPQANDLDSMVKRFGEPFANNSVPANFLLNDTAARFLKVALNGTGSDELFGGYDRYFAVYPPLTLRILCPIAFFLIPILRILPVGSGKRSIITLGRRFFEQANSSGRSHSLAVRLFMPQDLNGLLPHLSDLNNHRDLISDHYKHAPGADSLTKACWTDITTMLTDDYLSVVDRTSMAASLEVRVPYLDRDLVKFAFSLPSALKIHGWEKKVLLRRFSETKLPAAVAGGAKKGFESPVGAWFKGPLGEAMLGKLEDSPLRSVINTHFVRRLLQLHRKHRTDGAKQLLAVYTLIQWMDTFDVKL